MKTKLSYSVITVTAICVLAFTTLIAKQPPKPKTHGTDVLHWAVRKNMLNEGAVSNATAFVDAKQNQQGNANNQRLDVQVRKLDTNTVYQLWAALGDDTNFVHVADFATDKKGGAKLSFMQVGSSNGNAPAKGKLALPPALDPISNIRELAIGNVNTQAVFSADLTDPDKLQYLIQRSFSEGGVDADMRLKATTKKVDFRLYLWGLGSSTNYSLAINDAPVDSGTTTTNGMLSFLSLPVAPADILDVHKLAVWDSASNSVISTTLP